jgi:tetratricopeptide (TPR) repeat protein
LGDYDEAVRIAPDSFQLHLNRSSALVSLNAFDRAVMACETATRLAPKEAHAWVGKADALRLWGEALEAPAKLLESISASEQAIALDVNNSVAYALKGSALMTLEQFAEARDALDKSINFDKDYYWAWWEKGKLFYKLANIKGAEDAFGVLGDSKSEFATKAVIARELVRNLKKDMLSVSEILPDSGSADDYLQCATILLELHEWEATVAAYRKATALDTSSADAYNGLAWYQCEKLRKSLAECTDAAQRACDLAGSPEQKGNSLDTLGWIWFRRENVQEAYRCLSKAVELNEPDLVIRTHHSLVGGFLNDETKKQPYS